MTRSIDREAAGINLLENATINSNHSNRFMGAIDWIGHKLTAPGSRILEEMAKASSAITPNRYGQCSTKRKEIMARIGKSFLCLVGGLLTSPFILLGAGLRTLSTQLSRKSCTLLQPNTSPQSAARRAEKLSIETLNAAMMPECISVSNKIRPTRTRIKELEEALTKKSTKEEPDVICMQELFHTEAADKLAKKLRKKYPYAIYNIGVRSIGLSSGLAVFSKHPIKKAHYWKHESQASYEKYSGKGTVGVTLDLGGEEEATIFTSHFSGGGPSYNSFTCPHIKPEAAARGEKLIGGPALRYVQTQQLRKNIRTFMQGQKKQPVFSCGDLNMTPVWHEQNKGWEWNYFKTLFDPEQVENFEKEEAGFGSCFDIDNDPDTGWRKEELAHWRLKGEFLDHIFKVSSAVTPSAPAKLIKTKKDRLKGASDHIGIIRTFSLRK